MDIEGKTEELNNFISDIKKKLPPLARIEKIDVNQLPLIGYKGFSIKKSIVKEEDGFVLVSPDISICKDCLQELLDPHNRRFRYPFINCTNCGPRFTIIKDIPYDRDRRYHAQPNACADCGPQVSLYQNKKRLEDIDDPIEEAVKLLKKGKIGAIKGLGGFHLACDATNNKAVARLRRLKNRETKPFALMSPDLEKINQYCEVKKKEEGWLINQSRPVVLLKKKKNNLISPLVAPNNNCLGVMLPYTPLHYLLLKDNFTALIMTSGNIADQPIIGDNQEALEKLDRIADFFLLYNRDIFNRCDDSVLKIINSDNVFFRRSRGYVPHPIILDFKLKEVLALGGELKNTISFSKENYVFLSQYLGDLKSVETLNFLKKSMVSLKKMFRTNPEIIACDLHPDYLSTKYAEEIGVKRGIKVVKIQHHHAHIVSCMAENNIGNIWGGEFLLCDLKEYLRAGHLKYYSLPGGDKAIMEPWRMAYSYLYSIYGSKAKTLDIDFNRRMDYDKLSIIEKMIDKNINSPLTSSCGRLFDAASSLIGIRDEISYEGQAAMELESFCASGIKERYNFCICKEGEEFIIDPQEIFIDIIKDLKEGIDKKVMAAKFHNTVAEFTLNLCGKIKENTGINKIALSGGVFQNRYLTEKIISLLEKDDFQVYTQRKVPPNDGGISLGQAVVAGLR